MMLVPTELRPSRIHGIGAFLLAPVKKGEMVWRFDSRVDRVYSEDEMKSLPEFLQKTLKSYCTWYEPTNVWILNGDNGRHFNHEEKPSTVVAHNRVGFSDIVAARDLAVGDELTSDYRTICDTTRLTGEI